MSCGCKRKPEQRENYDAPSWKSMPMIGKSEELKNTQDTYSPCMDCTSIYNAASYRTPYDITMNRYYNTRARIVDYDLLKIQTAP